MEGLKQCLMALMLMTYGSTVLIAQTLKPEPTMEQPTIVGLKTEVSGIVVEAKVAGSKNVQMIKFLDSNKKMSYTYAIQSANLIQRGDTIYKLAGQNYYTIVKIDGSVSSVKL